MQHRLSTSSSSVFGAGVANPTIPQSQSRGSSAQYFRSEYTKTKRCTEQPAADHTPARIVRYEAFARRKTSEQERFCVSTSHASAANHTCEAKPRQLPSRPALHRSQGRVACVPRVTPAVVRLAGQRPPLGDTNRAMRTGERAATPLLAPGRFRGRGEGKEGGYAGAVRATGGQMGTAAGRVWAAAGRFFFVEEDAMMRRRSWSAESTGRRAANASFAAPLSCSATFVCFIFTDPMARLCGMRLYDKVSGNLDAGTVGSCNGKEDDGT